MSGLSVAPAERQYAFSDADFDRVRVLIHTCAGISLGDHKREMVYGRLSRRLRALGLTSFTDYLALLEQTQTGDEWQNFVNALTTNLTAFFREAHHFPILADFARTRAVPLAVWCCAAASGEEPYSIAMTLREALGAAADQATVLATDIDTHVLARARAAVYPQQRVDRLNESQKQRFLLRGKGTQAGRVRVKPEVTDMVTFSPLNLSASTWPIDGPFDVIFCRNVMIYFDKPTQIRILQRFAPLLRVGGLLFAGHSENFTFLSSVFRLRGQTVYELAQEAADEPYH